MSLEKSALRTKWWFVAMVLFLAIVTKWWVFSAAGVATTGHSFWSAPALLEYLVVAGLYYLYTELLAFLIRLLGPTLARRFPSTTR